MTVDWSKPVECSFGAVTVGMTKNHEDFGSIHYVTILSDIRYAVKSQTGEPIRNAALDDRFDVCNKPTNRDKALKILRNDSYCSDTYWDEKVDGLIKANLLRED